MLAQMHQHAAAGNLAIKRCVVAKAVFPIHLEAQKATIKLHGLIDGEYAEDRDRRLDRRSLPPRRRLYRLDLGGKHIPVVVAELARDEFERLAMGKIYLTFCQRLTQAFCHQFGIAKVAHLITLQRTNGKIRVRIADPFVIICRVA